MKAQADSSSRGWKDYICREEKRKAVWGPAGGPGNQWSPGSSWKLGFHCPFFVLPEGSYVSQVQTFPGKDKCLLGQLSLFGTFCSPSFITERGHLKGTTKGAEEK
jgi:hypothetical protein